MRIALPLLLFALPLWAEDIKPVKVPGRIDLANKKDPVDGKKVDGKSHLDWKGVRIHFASAKNSAAFAKEPKKYVAKLGLKLIDKTKGTGKVLSLENAKCPVTEEKADRAFHADIGGVRAYACCGKCRSRMKRDPAATVKALGYVWIPPVIDLRNKTCPVTGEQCYPSAPIWVDLDGIRVRVCCDKCVAAAKKDPARIFRLLAVDPKKLKERASQRS